MPSNDTGYAPPDLSRLRLALSDRNLAEVAKRTGINKKTLYRFMANRGSMISLSRYKRLHEYAFPGEVVTL